MSKKITEMPEVLGLLDTDFLTGIERAALPADQNVKIQKTNLGFAKDDDPRLSDSRDPNAHASTHATVGDDSIAPADIGAEPAFTKNTAFNKNFGTANGDVARGDAVPVHDGSAGAHPGYLPTAAQKTALDDNPTLGGTNAVAGKDDIVDEGIDLKSTGQPAGQILVSNGATFDYETKPQAGHVIQDGGTVRIQRANLNFVGNAVSADDNPGNNSTDVVVDAVQPSRLIESVAGETSGGGDLSDDRQIGLADVVGVAGSYISPNVTVDGKGRVTAAAEGSFIGLPDTPPSYSGEAGKNVSVNPGGDGLIFTDPPSGGSAHVIRDETQAYPQQPNLKFVGAGVSVDDLPGESATEVTITSGTDRHIIQDDTIPRPDRPVLNFVGLLVRAQDDPTNEKTDVTVDPVELLDEAEVPVTKRPVIRFSGAGVSIADNNVDFRTEIVVDGVPVAHKSSHAVGQSDELTPADIGAATAAQGALADSAVQPARRVDSGTGLTGGGDLSANRTLELADTAVTPDSYSNANITVDQQGRITFASDGAAGVQTFSDLTDTPANYVGQGGKAVAVNGTENGLEYVDFPGGGGSSTFIGLTDTPANYSGQQSNFLVVNIAENALEFETRQTGFNAAFGSQPDTVCEGDDPRLSDKRPVVSDVELDGYVETAGTGLPTTGTITIPLDGRIHEVTLTGDATIAVGAVPAGGKIGSAILFLTPAGNNVSYDAGLYWAGGAAVAASNYMRYTVSNAPGGNKIIDAEELATV